MALGALSKGSALGSWKRDSVSDEGQVGVTSSVTSSPRFRKARSNHDKEGYSAGGFRLLRNGSAASSWPLRLLKNIKAISPHPTRSEKKVPRPSAIQPCLSITASPLAFHTDIAQTPVGRGGFPGLQEWRFD